MKRINEYITGFSSWFYLNIQRPAIRKPTPTSIFALYLLAFSFVFFTIHSFSISHHLSFKVMLDAIVAITYSVLATKKLIIYCKKV